jgi:hypothetical protein
MYTTNSDHKLHSYTVAASNYCCDRATDGFIQARWQSNDVAQGATIGEFAPNSNIAAGLDGNEMVYGSYTEGYRAGSINRANKNDTWSRILIDHR